MLFLPASYTLLICAGPSQEHLCTACTQGPVWCGRPLSLLILYSTQAGNEKKENIPDTLFFFKAQYMNSVRWLNSTPLCMTCLPSCTLHCVFLTEYVCVHTDGKWNDNSSYFHPGCHFPSFHNDGWLGSKLNVSLQTCYTHSSVPNGAEFTETNSMWTFFTGARMYSVWKIIKTAWIRILI